MTVRNFSKQSSIQSRVQFADWEVSLSREFLISCVCVIFTLAPLRTVPQSESQIKLVGSPGQERVASAAFSRNGEFLLIGYVEGTARLWEAASQRQVREFPFRRGPVDNVAFEPDGTTILTAGDDGATTWNLATGQKLQDFPVKCGVLVLLCYKLDTPCKDDSVVEEIWL